jgi:energy-coupling factor transport system ATP-binding protein
MTDLRLEAVVYEYPDGVRGLDGVDLHIPSGSSLGLIGANGSGKTTLARHLDGLLRPSRGRLLIDGHDAAGLSVARLAREVGLCFQDPDRQIFKSDVRSEVEFGPRQLGRNTEEAFSDAKTALEAVGMGAELGRHPDDLGETQRKLLSMASVLAMQTPVVVLDEPTTGLDSRGVERVGEVIAGLRTTGRTVIGISHDMRFVAESFERIVLLDHGRVTLDGTPADVFAEGAWPTLRSSGLEPPYAAIAGAGLGLGSTPTEEALTLALRARGDAAPIDDTTHGGGDRLECT